MSLPPYVSPSHITDWSIDQPDLGTLLVRVRFAGARKRYCFWVLGSGVKRRYRTVAAITTFGSGPMLTGTSRDVDRAREGALAIKPLVAAGPVGQQVAHDWLEALRHKNLARLLEISEYATSGGRVQRRTPTIDRDLDALSRAAATLARHGRPDDAAEVSHLAAAFANAQPREKATSGQAARAIIEGFTHYGRLAPSLRTVPGTDGRTPEQDVLETVESAMNHLRAVTHATQEGDLQALRALRRYADQWAPRPDDPLSLG